VMAEQLRPICSAESIGRYCHGGVLAVFAQLARALNSGVELVACWREIGDAPLRKCFSQRRLCIVCNARAFAS
jgi:hypothetical protein